MSMWLSAIIYVVIVILLCVWFYRYSTYKPENFPPGPPRLPLWGSYGIALLFNWNFPHLIFQQWAKKYGDVFGMYIGDFLCVITCDYSTCKEVLNRVEFDGKPDILAARIRNFNQKQLGLFFTEGPFWHEQRRFSLRHLRDYGFGRRFDKLEDLMADQISQVIDFLKYPKQSPENNDILREDNAFYFPDILYPTQMNSIMSIFGMEPVQSGTARYCQFRHVGRAVLQLQHGFFPIMTMNVTPWTRYIAPKMTGYHNLSESNKVLFPFFKDIIEGIKNTKMNDDEVRCFYDLYFNKMRENEENNEENNTFSDDQLLMTTIDYMFPAVSAVPVVFIQVLYSLLRHPQVQKKMQAEIDEVVGRGRLPTLDDRKDLPYTESVIREVMRKETLVPLGIVHRVTEDTTLRGYSIPKDALLFTSLYGAHNDEKVWGDPENFRPERFTDATGKYLKKDYSLPFGAGKRLCAGETFARNSIFLLVTCLFQNFTFKMPPGVKLPTLEKKLPGLINSQKEDCWVHAVLRE